MLSRLNKVQYKFQIRVLVTLTLSNQKVFVLAYGKGDNCYCEALLKVLNSLF